MTSFDLVKGLKPLAIAVSLAIITTNAVAAENAETTNKQKMESIAVVGQTTNAEITFEELEKVQANDLADIFRSLPAVSVGGSLGLAQKIYIRGMEDTLLNITVDGAPQTSTMFHHMGRVSIDPELLKEVEIQAGAGEATSGAGAIGGAIRFKTKDVSDLLAADEEFGGSVKLGVFSNDGYRTSASLYGNLTENWGVLGNYTYTDRDNMEDGDSNEVMGTGSEQSLAFIKLNGELSDSQTLSVSYENRHEEGDFAQRPNWNPAEGAVLFPIETDRETIVVNHTLHTSELVNLETSFYHTTADVEQDVTTRWGIFGGETQSLGFDIRNTSDLSSHSITYGVEYRQDKVSAGSREADAGETIKEKGTVVGFYGQDHWQVSQELLLSFGLRYDQYDLDQVTFDNSVDSDGISANIGLNYDINDNLQFNLGYAQAMRGKEIGDSFTIESAIIDPAIEAEQVENTEIGLSYHDEHWHVTGSVYRSEIDDVIYDQLGQGIYYENIGSLKTNGVELKAAYSIDGLEVVASYSNNDVELNGDTVEGYEHIGLANERGDTWGLNVNYSVADNLEMGWSFAHVQSLNNIEVLQRAVAIGWIDEVHYIDKESYQTHDIYVQWQPLDSDALTVNFAVQNLFDEQYRDHSSVGDYSTVPGWGIVGGLYESGRDVRLSLSYQF